MILPNSQKKHIHIQWIICRHIKGVIGFRIFQERETGGGNDVYGIRYVETEIDYTCYHPEYYILKMNNHLLWPKAIAIGVQIHPNPRKHKNAT